MGSTLLEPEWKKKRTPGGVEWFSYPSALAQQVLLYPRSVGLATSPIGFKHEHHNDNGYLLHCMQKGSLCYRVSDRTYTIRAGEACMFDVGEDVLYRNSGRCPSTFYWVLFDGRDMQRFFQELRADRNPIFTQLDASRMRMHFRDLIALIDRRPQGFDFQASALLTMILARLFACRAPNVSFAELSGNTRPLSEPVRKGIDYITRFYDHRLVSIKAMAAASGRSLYYFSRLFHQEVGMSPIAYLNHFRVEQSKRLLEESDKSVSHVASRVGFPDQNYFAKAFKQIAGVSPQKYRSKSHTLKVRKARSSSSHES